MTSTLIGAIAIFAAIALPADAARKRNAAVIDGTYPASHVAPLTATECNRAHGSVVADTTCGTGAACIKDGPNGPSKICLSFSQ